MPPPWMLPWPPSDPHGRPADLQPPPSGIIGCCRAGCVRGSQVDVRGVSDESGSPRWERGDRRWRPKMATERGGALGGVFVVLLANITAAKLGMVSFSANDQIS